MHPQACNEYALQELINSYGSDDRLSEVSEDEAAGAKDKVAPQLESQANPQVVEEESFKFLATIAQVLSDECKNALDIQLGLERHAKAVKWAEEEIIKLLHSELKQKMRADSGVSVYSHGLGTHRDSLPPSISVRTPPQAPDRNSFALPPEEPPPSLMWHHSSTGSIGSLGVGPVSTLGSLDESKEKVEVITPSRKNEGCVAPLSSSWSPGSDADDSDGMHQGRHSGTPGTETFANLMPKMTTSSSSTTNRTSQGNGVYRLMHSLESLPGEPQCDSDAKDMETVHAHSAPTKLALNELHVPSSPIGVVQAGGTMAQTMSKTSSAAAVSPMWSTQPNNGDKMNQPPSAYAKGSVFQVLPIWNRGRKHNFVVDKKNNKMRSSALGSRLKRNFKKKRTQEATFDTPDGGTKSTVTGGIASPTEDSFDRSNTTATLVQNKRCTYSLHPHSFRRAMWDITSLVLVVYDMIMIPFALFEPPDNLFIEFFTWWTRIFWSLDMVMSFITGAVTNDGLIEMRLGQIAKRYLKSWFMLDIMIVGSDWAEFFMADSLKGAGYARAGKVSRAFRIIRMLRLLRLARMREVLGLILERIRSEKLIIVANVCKLTVLLLGLSHVVACVWWGIGASEAEPRSWVRNQGFVRESLLYQYTMSLHWSLSQFAGGMDEVTPENSQERSYAITVFLVGFVVASLFVSSLTSSMTQLDIIGSKQSQELSVLRRYLYQNGISSKLALRVQRNAQYAILEQQRLMPEEGVTLLNHVSEPLRMELHFEMYSGYFGFHPWISIYISECPQVMRKVCHIGTSMSSVSSGDVIFNAGEIPAKPKMYFVTRGTLQYESMSGMDYPVAEGTYLSEATLWTPWMHRGMLTASSDCRLCILDAKKFQEIAGSFHHSMVDPEIDPRAYAAEFVAHLNSTEEELTDLPRKNSTLTKRQTGTGFIKV